MEIADGAVPIIRNLGIEGSPPARFADMLRSHPLVVLVARTQLDLPPRDSDLSLLSADERARIASVAAPFARRFAYARRLLRESIATLTAADPAAIPISINNHGKPRIGGRQRNAPTHFNTAHSADCVAIVLSLSLEVGVDIERLRPLDNWHELAKRVLTESEQAELREAIDHGAEPAASLLRHWCRIEAAYKAIGTGLPAITSNPAKNRPTSVRIFDLLEASEESSEASLAPGFCGAVAVLIDRKQFIQT